MMKALVTGAGGFLGQYIVEQLLARGDQVIGLGRGDYPALKQLGIELVRGDIRDALAVRAACRGIDVVFHVAAVAGIWGPWKHYYGINTQGTLNVIDACRAAGVSRLVYTSSPSVTFDGGDQQGVDESAPYPKRWLAHYPHTKALAEQAVLAASGAYLLTCALRPHLIWGPRDQQLIPRLLQRARSGRLRRVGDGTNMIDTIYVENAADAHLLAADALTPGSPVCGQAYFLSNSEPVNCWRWINQVLQLADLQPVRRSISLASAWKIGYVLEAAYKMARIRAEPPMTRFLAAQLGHSHWFDISRARKDLQYLPRVPITQGLERLVSSWRSTR